MMGGLIVVLIKVVCFLELYSQPVLQLIQLNAVWKKGRKKKKCLPVQADISSINVASSMIMTDVMINFKNEEAVGIILPVKHLKLLCEICFVALFLT